MSRWVSLHQARAKALAKACGPPRKRREIFSYAGSKRSARPAVSLVGLRLGEAGVGPGMISPAFLATHWWAPAGDLVSSHSKSKRNLKKSLLHCAGVLVQVTSRPEVMVSAPLPLPKLLAQPRPCISRSAASG